jgi:proline iminopeptidase
MKKALTIIGISMGSIAVLLAVAFLVGYATAKGEYLIPMTVEQDTSLPHVKLGDALFHCETFGKDSNPVVIVVHGGPGDDYKNLLSLKALSDKYHVVFYDQRGAGLSPRIDPNLLTIETYVDDLHLFVKHFGKGKPVNLIGHSWGAMLASRYIGTYPELVHKAVLAEPGFLNTEMMNQFMQKTGGFSPKMSFALISHMAKTFFRMLHVKGPDEQARGDYFMLSMMTGPMEGNPILDYFCARKPSAAAFDKWRFGSAASMAVMRMIKNKDGEFRIDMLSGVDRFDRKVLFIASECNTIIGEEHQREQTKLFPNAELVVVKNAGHLMFAEQPEQSLAMVRAYLNETEEMEKTATE